MNKKIKKREIELLEGLRNLLYMYKDRDIPKEIKERWFIKVTKFLDKV